VIDRDFLRTIVPDDGPVIDQIFDRDQDVVDEEGMGLGHPQIAGGDIVGERSLLDDHGRSSRAAAPRREHTPFADPKDASPVASGSYHMVSHIQLFHGYFARGSANHGAGAEADDIEWCCKCAQGRKGYRRPDCQRRRGQD
jgi:hypothetical protein